MSLLEEKLTRDKFRELYQDCKPSCELIEGRLEQKALGSKRHARLQGILFRMLQELGFRSYVELSLAISEDWEPVPDVAGVLGPETDEVYQSEPPAVAIEILSPSDRFTQVEEKVEKYAEWGIADILVFDPIKKKAWYWEHPTRALTQVRGGLYVLLSKPGATLSVEEAFARLEQ